MNLTIEFVVLSCGADGCGETFAVPRARYDDMRNTHSTWYCPSGHPRAYKGRSEKEKLRDQLARTTAQLDQERACCREKSEKLTELNTRLVKTKAGYRGQIARQRKGAK